MYVKNSIMSGMVMVMGVFLLIMLVILFCFTEVQISSYASIAIWIACIKISVGIVGKIETPKKHSAE